MQSLPGSFTLNSQRFVVWSGNPAFPVDSADGAVFFAVSAKRSDKQMFFLVVRQAPDDALTLCYQSEQTAAGAGQGTLRDSGGQLVASYFVEAGDGKATRRVVIPGYVPFVSAPVAPGAVIPEPAIDLDAMPVLNAHQDYRDNAEVLGGADRGSSFLELIQRGWLYIRVNRIRQMLELLLAAVEQLQRQAKARGDLR